MATIFIPNLSNADLVPVRNYEASLNSEQLLRSSKPAGMTDVVWDGIRWRNKKHLELLLARGVRGNNNSNPFQQVLDANANVAQPVLPDLHNLGLETQNNLYITAMDSARLLHNGRPENMSAVEWEKCFERNKAHVRVTLGRNWNSWTNQDLAPLRDALNITLSTTITVAPLPGANAVVPPAVDRAPPTRTESTTSQPNPVAEPQSVPLAPPAPLPAPPAPVVDEALLEQARRAEEARQEQVRQEIMRQSQAMQDQMRAEEAARQAAEVERQAGSVHETRPWMPY